MKILVLNGSPRKKGNTSALVREFTRGAEQAGHEVSSFFLQGMDIKHCLGCYGGGKDKDSPCVQRDDMDQIYPVYREADVIVLASPMYFWSISGQLKTAIDRIFAAMEGPHGDITAKKQAVMLMAAEGEEYEECIYYYERLTKHLGWTDAGKVLVSAVIHEGDMEGNPALEDAYKLGASLA